MLNELLDLFIFAAALYPLRAISRVFRISEKRKNKLNMIGISLFTVAYFISLIAINDRMLQVAAIAAAVGITNFLFNRYMEIINHEYREKLLDDLVVMIENYERLHQNEKRRK